MNLVIFLLKILFLFKNIDIIKLNLITIIENKKKIITFSSNKKILKKIEKKTEKKTIKIINLYLFI